MCKILHGLIIPLLSVLIQAPGALAAAEQSFREESSVALEGTLEVQSFPGPPNYQSIDEGDEVERGLYLRLERPIAVSSSEGIKTVRILQLAGPLMEKHFQEGRKRRSVQARGKLFLRFNGHQHSQVLLDADSIEPDARALQ